MNDGRAVGAAGRIEIAQDPPGHLMGGLVDGSNFRMFRCGPVADPVCACVTSAWSTMAADPDRPVTCNQVTVPARIYLAADPSPRQRADLVHGLSAAMLISRVGGVRPVTHDLLWSRGHLTIVAVHLTDTVFDATDPPPLCGAIDVPSTAWCEGCIDELAAGPTLEPATTIRLANRDRTLVADAGSDGRLALVALLADG